MLKRVAISHRLMLFLPILLVVLAVTIWFALYEQNIGPLTPIIADRLRAAESQYPATWLEEAIAMAVEYNKRSWRYVETIQQRWEANGKDEGPERRHDEADDPNSFFRSKYAHIYR